MQNTTGHNSSANCNNGLKVPRDSITQILLNLGIPSFNTTVR